MVILRLILIFIFSALSFEIVFAQNFEWSKGYGSAKCHDNMNLSTVNANGNVVAIVGLNRLVTSNIPDTLQLDFFSFIVPMAFDGMPYRSYIIEEKTDGKVVSSSFLGSTVAYGLCTDNLGNYYVSSMLSKATYVCGKWLEMVNGNSVLAKYDKNFKPIWVKQYGDSINTGIRKIYYSQGQVFFMGFITGINVNFGGTLLSSENPALGDHIFGSIDTLDGDVNWVKYSVFGASSKHDCLIHDVLQMPNGKIFLAGTNISYKAFTVGSDTIYGNSGFVFRLSGNGIYERRFCFRNKYSNVSVGPINSQNIIYSIATDGKDIFIGGRYSDTSFWGKDTVVNSKFSSGGKNYESFVGAISVGLQPKWFYSPKKIVPSKNGIQSLSALYFNSGYLYAFGLFDSKFLIDSAIFDVPVGGMWSMFAMKLDVLGNRLWATSGGINPFPQNIVASGKAVYLCGAFQDTLTFGSNSINSKGEYDAFITKISDNTITRGAVNPGPYCAGDTFSIPYTKEGNFDSLNYFIAELSDEQGSFDKTVRRLGALRTNKDSAIRGVLPLFQVQSSANYRIRVRSTRPAVQSFYKLDTLKLLIYSRDKAYAGKDTAICPGDTIAIRTFGGTKWQWSPKVNMADSTQSSTRVWPKTNTTYRIVISDSSGCGAADTAYKTVILRYPKASLNTTDSAVCKGDSLWLTSTFKGGDSTGYTWQWQSRETGAWITQSKGQNQQQTVFGYKYNQDTAIALRLLLSDGCLRPQDTTMINVGPKHALKLILPNADTLLCASVPYTAKAKGQGGDATNYQFRWTLMPSNTVLSGTDSIRWSPIQNSQLRITLHDGCMEKADTQYVQINIRKPLQASSNLRDSTLCFGQHTSYTAQGTGGDTANYQYRWILNGKQIGTGKTLNFATETHFSDTGGQKTLQLIFADNCTTKNDTISAAIRVRPKLRAQLQYDSVFCFGTTKTLKARGTGGTGIYQFGWYDSNGKPISTADSITINHNDKAIKGQRSYAVTLSDGCSAPRDSQILKLNFLSPLTARISSSDSCLKTNTTLTATATGGDGNYTYHWYQNQLLQGQSKTLNIPLPTQETSYLLVVNDACPSDSAKATQEVSPYPQVIFSSDKDSGCELLKVNFYAKKQNATTNEYRYTMAGASTNWRTDSSYSYNFTAGKYTPQVEVKTKLGCRDTFQSKPITVHPKPIAAYSYTPARPVPKKPEVQFINRSTGAMQYQWNFGQFGSSTAPQPKVSMNETGVQSVYLVAINEHGCTDTSRGTVKVYEDYSVWLPNAFTPGSDNLNDQFVPVFIGVESYTLSIYNRWGQQVYSAENKGWDGTLHGKPVPEGMYVYTLKITTANYDKVQEQGVVMVLNPK